MTAKVSVKSRAHRTLRALSCFRMGPFAASEIFARERMRPGEEVIGVYQNSDPLAGQIVVTSLGLHVLQNGEVRVVPFESIVQVQGPSTKEQDQDVVLSLSDTQRVVIRIAGGHDRFKDVFEFRRFLARVLLDRAFEEL